MLLAVEFAIYVLYAAVSLLTLGYRQESFANLADSLLPSVRLQANSG